jgi:hypothetical protein
MQTLSLCHSFTVSLTLSVCHCVSKMRVLRAHECCVYNTYLGRETEGGGRVGGESGIGW